ncbi:MAG: hypothetical protein JWQ17_886 [Tardiphaga sp.]|jgi:hypothetical protein|nr:hypothetical protein [Tardiphaga sp.]
MTATFRKTEKTTNRKREEPTKAGGATISRIAVATPSSIAGSNGGTPPLEPGDLSGRQLRNRLIVANAIAWIVIIFLIGLVFF